jgi:hypothetical protein
MKKRGYSPAIQSDAGVAALRNELVALKSLSLEKLGSIGSLPKTRITRAELKRDFGFTDAGLRLLEALEWLVPEANGGRRKGYDLEKVVVMQLCFPGLCAAPRTRLVRKSSTSMATILKEIVHRIVTRSRCSAGSLRCVAVPDQTDGKGEVNERNQQSLN